MRSEIRMVKNPLTIIAIFAGTTEIGGTIILPFLKIENQCIYTWFLMLFPLILIVLFFLTLNWNHKVLYAPSDFSNEDHFMNLVRNPTAKEIITKRLEDIDGETKENELDKENVEKASDSTTENKNDDSILSKKKRDERDTVSKNINRQLNKESQMAELLVLNKLEKELNIPIHREMMVKIGTSKIIFDGVIQIGSSLIGVEVKYLRKKSTFNVSMWKNLFHQFESLYISMSESQKKAFSIILAIVTDENPKEMEKIVVDRMGKLNFPIDIRVYSFDELENEIVCSK